MVLPVCSFLVKADMKDNKGRSVMVLMDCDCALIDCLYYFALGGYKCIFVFQSTTVSKQSANLYQTICNNMQPCKKIMYKHAPDCFKILQIFNKLCANQPKLCINNVNLLPPQEHPLILGGVVVAGCRAAGGQGWQSPVMICRWHSSAEYT